MRAMEHVQHVQKSQTNLKADGAGRSERNDELNAIMDELYSYMCALVICEDRRAPRDHDRR